MAMGWSADNIAFGMGGALLQQVDRDTQKFAMKCSSMRMLRWPHFDQQWFDVQKDPATDPGKKSKAGRVTLWKSGGEYISAVDKPTGWADRAIGEFVDVLQEVYRDGKLVNEIDFATVRANSNK